MRKLFVSMWVSLDGYIAGPKNDMSFVGENYNDQMGAYEGSVADRADTLVLGRVTYQSFAGAWPHVPEMPDRSEGEKQYARQLNAMRKIVFSKTLPSADWNNSTLYREIDPAQIEKIKSQPGKDMAIYGSASVIQELTNLGLIDEYQILVFPIILGGGKPLFKDIHNKVKLKLADSKAFASGVVFLTYQVVK